MGTRAANPLARYKLQVKGKRALSLARQIAKGIKKSGDLCRISPSVCEGNLGIPRNKMPQIADTKAFLSSQRAKGRKVIKAQVPVGDLMATQREIDACKVEGMLKSFRAKKFPGIRNEIVVSSDGYILDGHHRWATLLVASPGEIMNVKIVNAPIEALLWDAVNSPGVTTSQSKIPIKCKNRGRGMTRRNARGAPVDEAALRELHLFVDNDAGLHRGQRASIVKNLERKIKRGVYDSRKAPTLWAYLADSAAQKYHKQFAGGGRWHDLFPKPLRQELGKRLAKEWEEEAKVQGVLKNPRRRRGKNPLDEREAREIYASAITDLAMAEVSVNERMYGAARGWVGRAESLLRVIEDYAISRDGQISGELQVKVDHADRLAEMILRKIPSSSWRSNPRHRRGKNPLDSRDDEEPEFRWIGKPSLGTGIVLLRNGLAVLTIRRKSGRGFYRLHIVRGSPIIGREGMHDFAGDYGESPPTTLTAAKRLAERVARDAQYQRRSKNPLTRGEVHQIHDRVRSGIKASARSIELREYHAARETLGQNQAYLDVVSSFVPSRYRDDTSDRQKWRPYEIEAEALSQQTGMLLGELEPYSSTDYVYPKGRRETNPRRKWAVVHSRGAMDTDLVKSTHASKGAAEKKADRLNEDSWPPQFRVLDISDSGPWEAITVFGKRTVRQRWSNPNGDMMAQMRHATLNDAVIAMMRAREFQQDEQKALRTFEQTRSGRLSPDEKAYVWRRVESSWPGYLREESIGPKGAPYVDEQLLLAARRKRSNPRRARRNPSRPLYEIAKEIKRDWGAKINYAARPFLDAMSQIGSINDMYGSESARSVVAYFLGNAGTWRGPTAKRIKAELRAMSG